MPTIKELIDALEAEINNGGFDQFFFNSAGDYTEETIQALVKIGANHTAHIVKKAASKFPNGMPPKDRDARQELLDEVSPESDAFEEIDEEFLAYEDNLSSLVSCYEG
ncbi:DMP19 family protein [Shewanella cyperi]|uniref:DMP19 family protein n=1 Tax=Shewanella cyperi TaxID=2814292 RepID=A0A975AM79_9GAMM|nr:DMP19 family protein [Shewanella cyperi]QSX31187.1 DMP19 family protein [Shewanella cyperi]